MPVIKSKKHTRKQRERHIPTPIKLYLRQFFGKEALEKPLTEEYFQPEELKAINLLIEQSRQKTRTTKRVGRQPKPRYAYSPRSGKASMGFKVPSDWIREDTYDPKGTVTYEDYDQLAKYLGYKGGQRPAKAIKQFSAEDPIVPYQSVQHTLGQFGYEEVKDPDTGKVSYKVTDVYDWDPVYGPHGLDPNLEKGEGRYPKWRDLPNIIAGQRPESHGITSKFNIPTRLSNLAEWTGAKFGPRATEGEGIKFDIDVPQREYDFDYSHIDELLKQKSSKKGGILKRTKKRKKKTNNKIISGKIMYGYKAGGKV